MINMKKLFLFILLICSISAYSTVYHVATGGSGDYTTIAQVNAATFSAGDQILFNSGDTWAEALVIPSSGTFGNPIMFGAYGTGAKPIITGSDSRDYCISTNNKSYITIDGLNLIHALGSSFDYAALKVGPTTVIGIIIKNCTIEDNRKSGIVLGGGTTATSVLVDSCVIQNNGSLGILVYDWNGGNPSPDYTTGQISNCQVYTNGAYADTDVQQYSNIQGNLANFNIFGNTIYNAAPGSITYPYGCHGIYVSTATTGVANIHDNIIYGNTTGAGIKARYSANIYNNLIYNNFLHGLELGANGSTDATYNVYYNVMYGVTNGYDAIHQQEKSTGQINLNIYNNTIYKIGFAYDATCGVGIEDNITSLVVKNNIFYGADDHGGIYMATTQSNATIDYNLYWKDTQSGAVINYYNNTLVSGLTAWRALGFDAHGINDNPDFVSTTDFHLQSGSPAKDAGTNVSLTTDYEGRNVPYNSLYDIGAYEYGASIPTLIRSAVVKLYRFPNSQLIRQ